MTAGVSARELRKLRRRPAAGVHGALRVRRAGPAAADPQRQARPQGAARAGVHRRHLPGARAPRAEEILAAVYAEVLGLDRVGIDDDFFAVGGDSIRSIQVVSRARAQGIEVSPRQIFEQPHRRRTRRPSPRERHGDRPAVLEELDGGGVGLDAAAAGRPLACSNSAAASTGSPCPWCWNCPRTSTRPQLAATLTAVLDRHDMLRSRLGDRRRDRAARRRTGHARTPCRARCHRVACDGHCGERAWQQRAAAELDAAAGRLDPAAGTMAQFVWFDAGTTAAGRLLLALHHLVVDGVSWRILIPDLAAAWQQVRAGRTPQLPAGRHLRCAAGRMPSPRRPLSPERTAELDLWRTHRARPATPCSAAGRSTRPLDVRRPRRTPVSVQLPGDGHRGPADHAARRVPRRRQRRPARRAGPGPRRWRARPRRRRALRADPPRGTRPRGGRRPRRRPVPHRGLVHQPCSPSASTSPASTSTTRSPAARPPACSEGGQGTAPGRPRQGHRLRPAALPQPARPPPTWRQYPPARSASTTSAGSPPPTCPATCAAWASPRPRGATIAELAGRRPGPATCPPCPTLDINAAVTDSRRRAPARTPCSRSPTGVLAQAEVQRTRRPVARRPRRAGPARHQPGAGGLTPSDLPLVTVDQHDIDELGAALPGPGRRLAADRPPVRPAVPLQLLDGHRLRRLPDAVASSPRPASVDAGPACAPPARRCWTGTPACGPRSSPTRDGDLVQLVLDDVDAALAPHRPRRPRTRRTHGGLRATPRAGPRHPLRPRRTAHAAADPGHRSASGPAELVLTAHHVLFDGWSVPAADAGPAAAVRRGGRRPALPRSASYRDFLAWLSRRTARSPPGPGPPNSAGSTSRPCSPRWSAPRGPPPADGSGDRPDRHRHRPPEVPLPAGPPRAPAARRRTRRHPQHRASRAPGRCCWPGSPAARTWSSAPPSPAARPRCPASTRSVGMFINTLPVRVECAPADTLAELLTALQDRQAALLDHHHYGLAEIQQAAGVEPSSTRSSSSSPSPSTGPASSRPAGRPGSRSPASAPSPPATTP